MSRRSALEDLPPPKDDDEGQEDHGSDSGSGSGSGPDDDASSAQPSSEHSGAPQVDPDDVSKILAKLVVAVGDLSGRLGKVEGSSGAPDSKEEGPSGSAPRGSALGELDRVIGVRTRGRRDPKPGKRRHATKRPDDSSDSEESSSDPSDSRRSRRHHRRRRGDRRTYDLEGRLAMVFHDRLFREAKSALEFVRRQTWDNVRSRHEARRTAQVIDQLLREGIGTDSLAMEMLLRNLTGLCEADKCSDASILAELEWQPPEELIPRNLMRTIRKDAERRSKFDTKTKKPRPAGAPKAPDDKKGKGGGGGGKRQ